MNIQTSDSTFEDAPNAACADLRMSILEANEAGDVDRLAQLRAEYRAAAHGGQGRTSAPHVPAARRTSPRRSAVVASDPTREIVCRIARFNVLGVWGDRDGKPSWGYFRTGCFDDWLAKHSPADLAFSLEHESVGSLARWRDLWLTPDELWGVATVERGADAVLEYADTVATGCSVGAQIVRETERWDSRANGEPIYDLHECRLLDAGPVAEPADPECWVISVRGEATWHRKVAEKHERYVQLAGLGVIQPADNRPAWRPRFGA